MIQSRQNFIFLRCPVDHVGGIRQYCAQIELMIFQSLFAYPIPFCILSES